MTVKIIVKHPTSMIVCINRSFGSCVLMLLPSQGYALSCAVHLPPCSTKGAVCNQSAFKDTDSLSGPVGRACLLMLSVFSSRVHAFDCPRCQCKCQCMKRGELTVWFWQAEMLENDYIEWNIAWFKTVESVSVQVGTRRDFEKASDP